MVKGTLRLFLCAAAFWVAACGDNIEGNIDAGGDDDTCTPVDDSNECTADVCEDGLPVHNPLPEGTTCTGGTCDDAGTCVPTEAVCGDGAIEGDEACDDGDTDAGDGCDADCEVETGYTCVGEPSVCSLITPVCGDGSIDGAEGCDDGDTDAGDGCDADCEVEDGYTCTGEPSVCSLDPAVCGDGAIEGTEECDDSDTDDGDGCDSDCAVEDGYVCTGEPSVCVVDAAVCGDGDIEGAEQCDDGDTDDGDGCDSDCAVEAGYTCTGAPSVCMLISCGDGSIDGTEACDDGDTDNGDGCSATCAIEPGYGCTGEPSACVALCGNGTEDAGETCDDGNTTALDGCSATCFDEVNEIEPNEDGTPQTGGSTTTGNDFDGAGGIAVGNANANGAFDIGTGPHTILAALMPVGDEDVFALTNTSTGARTVHLNTWSSAVGFGVGVACGNTDADVDTVITIRSATGTSLAQNDDRVNNVDRCSSLDYLLSPGATVYIHISEYGDNLAIPGYGLLLTSDPLVCGDGTQTPGFEECDDGNSANGDGCSSICDIETTPELEPNEDGTPSSGGSGAAGNDFDAGGLAVANSTAQGVIDVGTTRGAWRAALSPAGDEDAFAVTNTGTVDVIVTADTHDPALGLGRPCTIDTGINLRDAAGALIASNDQIGTGGNCSRMQFTLAPGQSRYINVVYWNDNTTVGEYVLTINRQPIVCGDGVAVGAEECDDGNTVDTDACTNACLYGGVVNEVEPNGTFVEADASVLQVTETTTIRGAISPIADLDTYKVTVATATVLRMETFVGALGRCDSTTTVVRIFDSAGTQITVDTAAEASGIAGCGALVLPVAAGTYYVRVEENGNNAAIAKYFLQVAFAADAGAESEAVNTSGVNDTSATASTNLATATESFVFGDHTLLADADYYTITVPPSSAVRLEAVEGDRATETCEATAIDTHIQAFGPDGTTSLGLDDDDGRGWCSVLDGTGATPRDSGLRNTTASPVTWFARVRSSGTTGAANQFSYRLLVTIRPI